MSIPVPAAAVPRPRPRRTANRRPSVLAVVAIAWLVVLIAACALADVLTSHNPLTQSLADALQLPSALHPLGTDGLGRDVLSRLLYGGRTSLSAAVTALAVAALVGAPIGLVAGYRKGGITDVVATRVVDLLQSIPAIVILLAVLAMTGRNVYTSMIVFGVIVSPTFFRLARDGAASVSRELFVDAAKVFGVRPIVIVFRHVAPNIASPLFIQATIVLSLALLTESGLSYLGLSTPPPAPSWGGSIADANAYINQQPWLLVPSGLLLVLTILAFSVLGDVVRNSLPGAPRVSSHGVVAGRRPFNGAPTQTPVLEDSDVLLRVNRLVVRAGETPLLQDVDLTLRRGQILALVGESGSGKTMTAMAVMGLLPDGVEVADGSIRLDGEDLLQLSERQLRGIRGSRIGYIGQEPMVSLDPMFTVRAQIAESIRIHRKGTSIGPVVLELLSQVGIPEPARVAASFPHQLSGGMAQRVCIAMALAAEPELLIADEPTTALDATVQAGVLDLLRELCASRNMAMIIVTHDFGVVADIADSAIVMNKGRIVEAADIEPLFENPEHPYTRALLAANPANAGDEAAVWYDAESARSSAESTTAPETKR